MKKGFVFAVALVLAWAACAEDVLDAASAAYKRRDFATTLKLVKPLSDDGVPRAQHSYGLLLYFGQGVAKDEQKGVELITSAAQSGYAKAQSFLAFRHYFLSPNLEGNVDAATWAQKSAAQGEPTGQAILGYAYLYGLGVPQNFSLARDELSKSASSDNPLGQLHLGKMELVGLGGKPDAGKAEQLLKSVALNPEVADLALPILQQGQGLLTWRQGLSRLTCDGLLCAGTWGANRTKLKQLYASGDWIALAAHVIKLGNKEDLAYFYLGRSAEGIGDFESAAIYYRLAIDAKERGMPCAGIVNNCDGFVFPRDVNARTAAIVKARSDAAAAELAKKAQLEKEAADARALALRQQEEQRAVEAKRKFEATLEEARTGGALAQYQLAQLYFSGLGVEASDEQGIRWLKESAVGLPQAQYELGERFYRGKGVAVDVEMAEAMLKSALQRGHSDINGSYAALQAELKERRGEMVYASTPFNTKADVLTKGLRGSDVRSLVTQLLRTPYPQKTDFETVDDHKKRAFAWEEKLRSSVGLNRLQAFIRNGFAKNKTNEASILDFDGYDIDSQTMKFQFSLSSRLVYEDGGTYLGAYEASNAFGAKLRVERWHNTTYGVQLNDVSLTGEKFSVIVQKEIAERISKNVSFVLIGRLVAPYAEQEESGSGATFKNPYEIRERNYSLIVEPVAFWLVDPITGKVLFKADAKKKK